MGSRCRANAKSSEVHPIRNTFLFTYTYTSEVTLRYAKHIFRIHDDWNREPEDNGGFTHQAVRRDAHKGKPHGRPGRPLRKEESCSSCKASEEISLRRKESCSSCKASKEISLRRKGSCSSCKASKEISLRRK